MTKKVFTLFLLLFSLQICKATSTLIPLIHSSFKIVYDGYGFIRFIPGGEMTFASSPSSKQTETHAVLLLLQKSVGTPLQNFNLRIEATTEKQLRNPIPNTWETFWIFFNYNSKNGQKETNYFAHKTNGVELGKAFDDSRQQFLYTSLQFPLKVGQRYKYELIKTENNIKVIIDNQVAIDYSFALPSPPANRPLPFTKAGSIGLYTEDALVRVHSCVLDNK